MPPTIISLENPHDFSNDDLEDLRQHLAREAPDADVLIEVKEEHGYGVNLYEVVQVVADVRGAGGDYVLAALLLWMRKRWRRDKDQRHPPRPRSVVILDADGNRLRTINIDEPDGEPHDEDDD